MIKLKVCNKNWQVYKVAVYKDGTEKGRQELPCLRLGRSDTGYSILVPELVAAGTAHRLGILPVVAWILSYC